MERAGRTTWGRTTPGCGRDHQPTTRAADEAARRVLERITEILAEQ
jgi:hypothetical protein